MTEQLRVCIASELKRKLARMASLEGETSTRVVRELIEDCVRQRDSPAYVDDLWTRIGADLARKGVRQVNVAKAIKAIRRPGRTDAGRH